MPRAHEVGIVYFTVWRLFRFASKIAMFAYFVVENPRFLFHFMTDNGCIFTSNASKHTKTEDNPVSRAHEVGIVYFTVCETIPVCFEDHHVCLFCS